MSASRALVLFVFAAVALLCGAVTSSASDEPAGQSEGVAKVVADLKASGCKTVAVVAVKDALTPAEQEALVAQAAEAGLSVVLRVVDLGSAEDLAAEIERLCQSDAEAILPLGDPSAIEAVLQQMRNVATGTPILLYETEGGAAKLVKRAKELTVDLGNNAKMDLVLVSPGTFLMGSKDGDADEKPVHKVTVAKAFYMGKYEVTCGQWKAVMGSLPEDTGEPDDPVVNVSWNDCQESIEKLNQEQPRYVFRLPTEAEWEYACRAGSKTQYCFGDDENGLDEYAWYSANSGVAANPVGRKKPNAWGLYDMHGNVWEWCQDWKAAGYYIHSPDKDPAGPSRGETRVIRGGSWYVEPVSCRSANRSGSAPEYANADLGFRLVVVPR